MEPEKIQQNVRLTLPDARLVETALPLIPDMRLYLLDPVNLQRKFSSGETRKIMGNTPYWSFCWASGQALGSYISGKKELVKGKRVLDFGSGSGVVGIAAARAGAERTIACDADNHALEAVKANAKLNRVFIETIRTFDDLRGKVDIVLVSDLLYDPDNFPLLDRFFDYADEVILADSRVKNFRHSRYRPIDCIQAVTMPDLQEGDEYKQVRLYRNT